MSETPARNPNIVTKIFIILHNSTAILSLLRAMGPIQLNGDLQHLRVLLQQLPDTVPSSSMLYNFNNFTPDLDKVELYGTVEAAVNQTLEVTFAVSSRN